MIRRRRLKDCPPRSGGTPEGSTSMLKPRFAAWLCPLSVWLCKACSAVIPSVDSFTPIFFPVVPCTLFTRNSAMYELHTFAHTWVLASTCTGQWCHKAGATCTSHKLISGSGHVDTHGCKLLHIVKHKRGLCLFNARPLFLRQASRALKPRSLLPWCPCNSHLCGDRQQGET